MATDSPGGAGDLAARLRRAEATGAEQQREIAALRSQLADAAFADELREALVRQDASGQWAAPAVHNELLEMIVRTAAHVLDARGATLYLVDYESYDLEQLTSYASEVNDGCNQARSDSAALAAMIGDQ